MTAHDSFPRPTSELPPLGTAHREPTDTDRLANEYFHRCMVLDPVAASQHGLPGYGDGYPDYGPEGRAKRAELRAQTLQKLEQVAPVDHVDRVTAHALRDQLECENELHAAHLDVAPVNNIASPVQDVRAVFDNMPTDTTEDWERITRRMRHVPGALGTYVEGLREAESLGRPGSVTQLREAETQLLAARGATDPAAAWEQQQSTELALSSAGPGALVNGQVTSCYGSRWGTNHNGIDIAAPIGTPIFAPEGGVVLQAGPANGFGLAVYVQHPDGTMKVSGVNFVP